MTDKEFEEYRKRPYRKRIPYGMMNFIDVREDDCAYIEKTRFIEQIEDSNKFFFFIRPRRFGKSLTLSMLRHYYDIEEADKFEKWYGDLYIGKHPTKERNSYLVIYLNLAIVNAEIGTYRQSLDAHCDTRFDAFCDKYKKYLPAGTKEKMKAKNGAVEQLDCLITECTKANQSIYLFIDEYDHFTNKILSEPDCLDDYKSETHGTGYLRNFFDTIKAGTDTAIKRVFLTGVTPVTLDDLTSGFNIGTNYSLNYEYNQMTGFTEQEVRELLTYYSTVTKFNHSIDELIRTMKPWYDNYCFAPQAYGETSMYNSNMVLYFIDNYIHSGGRIPENMIEENIRVDYNKLRMKMDKLHPNIINEIYKIIKEQGYITSNITKIISLTNLLDKENIVNILFSKGLLTIVGTKRGETCLSIPNKTAECFFFKPKNRTEMLKFPT